VARYPPTATVTETVTVTLLRLIDVELEGMAAEEEATSPPEGSINSPQATEEAASSVPPATTLPQALCSVDDEFARLEAQHYLELS